MVRQERWISFTLSRSDSVIALSQVGQTDYTGSLIGKYKPSPAAMSNTRPPSLYVDTAEMLDDICVKLSKKPYIALDTEFLRERTYRPQLCLIQVKVDDILACIDTQAIDDLSPLMAVLQNPNITKVLHAASQDLEIFYLYSKGKVPTPIFDTQLAAPLLGYNEQIGYGNLVKEMLGVELSKAHTRADWTRRPLPEKQIEYALDDVIYLEQLYNKIHAQLSERDRLEWLAPEFAEWENPEKYDQPAKQRWLKIRNIQRYKGPALACIQALAEWREIKARELNLPRNWLIKDDVLCSIGQLQPDSLDELSHVRGLDNKSRERYGNELVELINAAKDRTPEPAPAFIKKKKLNAANLARVALLDAWVHQRAAELDINSTILASPKLLEKCVTADCSEALRGWREPLLLADFTAILDGKMAVSVAKNGLVLTPA